METKTQREFNLTSAKDLSTYLYRGSKMEWKLNVLPEHQNITCTQSLKKPRSIFFFQFFFPFLEEGVMYERKVILEELWM